MIPFELVTMLGSGVFSGVLTLWSKAIDAKKEQHRLTMDALRGWRQGVQEAREVVDKGFSFTRRTIALTVVFSVVLLPKVVAVGWPEVNVVVGYSQWVSGFWPFTEGKEVIKWTTANGFVITPLDTHFTSAVIGLYFGHKVSK